MMSEKFYEELKEKIQPYFGSSDGHAFDHVERVYNTAIKIGEEEEVDMDIVRAAALLHDVARSYENEKGVCHAEEGARMAVNILKEVGFPEEKIEAVAEAIRVHRYSKGLEAKTLEAQILQDADRLDALGAIILTRVFEKCGKDGTPIYDPDMPLREFYDGSPSCGINHLQEKCFRIKPETFKTAKAREMAMSRYDYLVDFVDQFKKEWSGDL